MVALEKCCRAGPAQFHLGRPVGDRWNIAVFKRSLGHAARWWIVIRHGSAMAYEHLLTILHEVLVRLQLDRCL